MNRSLCSRITVMVALLLVWGAVASADIITDIAPPTITIEVGGQQWQADLSQADFDLPPAWFNDFLPPGLQNAMGHLKQPRFFNGILGGLADVEIRELEFNPDPTVYHNLLITNNTATTQSYTLTSTLNTGAFAAPNLIHGSITTQVQDCGSDGAQVAAPAGGAIYNAQIDGTTVKQMQVDPFSISTTPPNFVNNNLEEFGPQLSNIPVNNNIGIVLTFELSPGDEVSILSRFDVLVPEPASMALLGIGGLAMLRRRR